MFRDIASDFDRLSSASWVITAYLLGLISAQPLVKLLKQVMLLTMWTDKEGRKQYGKLSDIYGRKSLLLVAYACYCFGGLLA
jgi:MFS family permease